MGMLLMVAVLINADGPGNECEAGTEVREIPFNETVDSTGFPVSLLQFNEADRLEVKGKWYHYRGEGKVVKASTCSENTKFNTFTAIFRKCDKSASGYLYEYLIHTDQCSLNFYGADKEDYFIIIGGTKVNNQTFNDGTMFVEFTYDVSPDEHVCEKAVEIGSLPFTVTSQTAASEPTTDTCQNAERSGMWYHFVGTGKSITAQTCDETTSFDTVLSVHDSCDTSSRSCVSMNDDSCGMGSVLTFDSEEGKDYYLFVSGAKSESGIFRLTVEELGYSEHGYCTEAIEIDTLPFVGHYNTKMLPSVHSECQNNDRRGIWFYIKRVTTELIAMTCDDHAGFSDTAIDVFADCDTTKGTGVGCEQKNDDFCGLNAAVYLQPTEKGYYLFVSGSSTNFEGQDFTLTIQNNKNQTNDRCWQASRIFTFPVDFSGNTRNMKADTTSHCSTGTHKTRHGAWFSYVNNGYENRLIGATTCNSENVMHADIEVFSNCDACQVAGVYDDQEGCSNVSFLAKPGVNYSIFVTATEGEEDGFFHVDFYHDEPSANQHCDAPQELGHLPAYAVGFTSKSNPSYSSCDGGHQWQGLWYKIRGTGQRLRAATVEGSTHFDSLLELHSGCPASGGEDTCLAMNDDTTHQSLSSSLEWDSKIGTEYYLFVRGYQGQSGMFALNVYELTEPSNSKCVNALDISLDQPAFGYTSLASASKADCEEGERQGLWYKLNTNNINSAILSTCDSATTFDTDIEVYTTCSNDGASGCVEHSHDFRCSRGTFLMFNLESGKNYYIFVTGNRTDVTETGFFRLLAVATPLPPSNASSSSPFESISSSSVPESNGMEIVEVFLVVFVIALLASIGFAIACCFYKRPSNKSYAQMEVPDGLDAAAESSTYVPPDSLVSTADLNEDRGTELVDKEPQKEEA